MKLREEVVTLIRSNQQLENDLNLMDIKIGLLVKNKITLQVLYAQLWRAATEEQALVLVGAAEVTGGVHK